AKQPEIKETVLGQAEKSQLPPGQHRLYSYDDEGLTSLIEDASTDPVLYERVRQLTPDLPPFELVSRNIDPGEYLAFEWPEAFSYYINAGQSADGTAFAVNSFRPAKYQQYTIPGGENYR